MDASIERGRFLAALHIRSGRDSGPRWESRGGEPVWVGNRARLNEVNLSWVRGESSEHMRHRVQCLEALVHRHLQDGARGIARTIGGANARTVPSAAISVRTFAAAPRWPKPRFVQPPRNQFR
jgi:hypothetical protein